MLGFILTLSLITAWLSLRPLLIERDARRARRAADTYRSFQAFAVLKYHPAFRSDPELGSLSVQDVRRRFNLSELYNQLGRE